jgi:hypothetical protein
LDETYTRVLTDEDLEEVNIEDVKVSRVPAERAKEFRSWSVAGYRDGGRAEILLDTIARIAVLRADTSLYVATIDGKVVGILRGQSLVLLIPRLGALKLTSERRNNRVLVE